LSTNVLKSVGPHDALDLGQTGIGADQDFLSFESGGRSGEVLLQEE
jgi:hypothetical protein